jgi:hypothetical protein
MFDFYVGAMRAGLGSALPARRVRAARRNHYLFFTTSLNR